MRWLDYILYHADSAVVGMHQEEEARKCFESYDADGKGTIDFAELFAVCHWGCLHVGVMYV